MSENENEQELMEEELPDIDYVYGNEDYDPNAAPAKTYADLMDDENSGGRVRLSDMNAPKKNTAENLRLQMIADDLAMSAGDRPVLKEMSDRYAGRKNDLDELIEKKVLGRNEKEALKNRLQEEIGSRPEGFNQRRSLEMYHQLMDEPDEKEAQRGFFLLMIFMMLGVGVAALEFFLNMNPEGDISRIYMDYIHFATLLFSIVMLFRAKFFKVLSAIYFMANSAALIVPGLMVYAMDPANQQGGESGEFIINLTMYLIAIIFSVVIFIRLLKDKTIAAYYSKKKKRKR